jgi:hypothetical protein
MIALPFFSTFDANLRGGMLYGFFNVKRKLVKLGSAL